MTQPLRFVSTDQSLLCKLNKDIYGLKQSPRAWYEKLHQALFQFGFTTSRCDNSLFVYNKQGISLYAFAYVDDILITGSNFSLILDLINKLHIAFDLEKTWRPSYFLGVEVRFCSNRALFITQSKYIQDLLARDKMRNANLVPTPMLSTCKLNKHGTNNLSNPQLYMTIIAALQYVTLTKLDIAFSVNKACQFMVCPLDTHWSIVRRLLRYLNGIAHYGLLLSPFISASKFSLRAYRDSDQESNLDDRRSTSGSCIFFGLNMVSWSSKKKSLVARSSMEVEYRTLAHTTSEMLQLESLLSELKFLFTRQHYYVTISITQLVTC